MNPAQIEAIAVADAHTNNVALPTYSELVEALRDQSDGAAYRLHKGHDNADADTVRKLAPILARIGSAA